MRRKQKEERARDQSACDGYLRQPHPAFPVLYFQLPDGTRKALCEICSTRWLLSEEEWPPKNPKPEAKEPSLTNTKIAT